jgi:hypothetical protein
MLTEEQKEDFVELYRKLADIIIEHDVTQTDTRDLMLEDPNFQRYRDIVGKNSAHIEWSVHPKHANVSCSTEGDIMIGGRIVTPIEYDGELKVSIQNGKRKMSAAVLILMCFKPYPNDGGIYKVAYRNNNFRDLRVCNLYWYCCVE